MTSVQAVYIAIHTLSPQPSSSANSRFMDVEKNGLQNVITACRSGNVRRIIYVTSLGIAPDAPSEWLRERWHSEQLLLNSGLDATVIQPGHIVGVGGRGLEMQGLQESRFNQPSNNKGSGRRKIMSNDCQNHETQMGIVLVNRAIDLKWVLYVFMWAVPVSGVLLSNSFRANNVKFFGFVLPDIFPQNQTMEDLGRNLHFWLSYSFLAFVVLHTIEQRKIVRTNWRRFRQFIRPLAD